MLKNDYKLEVEALISKDISYVTEQYVPERLRDASPERLGAFQLDLRRELIRSGEFYIVPATKDGVGALRVTVINPLTTPGHLDLLLEGRLIVVVARIHRLFRTLLPDCHSLTGLAGLPRREALTHYQTAI